MTRTPIGSGRALFDLPDFRVWAMNGAPRLELKPIGLDSPKQPKEAA